MRIDGEVWPRVKGAGNPAMVNVLKTYQSIENGRATNNPADFSCIRQRFLSLPSKTLLLDGKVGVRWTEEKHSYVNRRGKAIIFSIGIKWNGNSRVETHSGSRNTERAPRDRVGP